MFGIPCLDEAAASAAMPPPAKPPCGNCAAVKRLKTCSGGAEQKWLQQVCSCQAAVPASAVTAAQADAPSGMSVPLTNAIDTLRPRRLFEGEAGDEDIAAASPGQDCAAAEAAAPCQSAVSSDTAIAEAAAPAGTHDFLPAGAAIDGGLDPPSVFDLLDDGEEEEDDLDAAQDSECWSIFLPPQVQLPDISGGGGLASASSTVPGGAFASGMSSQNASFAILASRPFSPSPLLQQHRPSTPLSGGFGNDAPRWERGPSPPPPPPLPDSSQDAARNAYRGLHNQSPGLMLASVRHDLAIRNGASSCGASSCATPSRAPLPQRPPTPGAPGSNMRRTTSFMDGGIPGLHSPYFADSPGATPERATPDAVVPMSLTDTAILQLTQDMATSFSIGPIGQKRKIFEDRDA